MSFEEIIRTMKPLLIKLVDGNSRNLPFLKEDLLSIIIIHLFEEDLKNNLEDKTRSYIYQNCWFYLKNYLRLHRKEYFTESLDNSDDNGIMLKDTIADASFSDVHLEAENTVNAIKSNGLSPREKEVFRLMLEGFYRKRKGYTTREIADVLHISHVRVFKLQKTLMKKVQEEYVW